MSEAKELVKEKKKWPKIKKENRNNEPTESISGSILKYSLKNGSYFTNYGRGYKILNK